MNKCACGCGNLVSSPQNKYIAGHNQRGKPAWNFGKTMSYKGIPHTKEHNMKVGQANRIALKKYFANPANREKYSNISKQDWKNHPDKYVNSLKALSVAAQQRKSGILASGALGKKHTAEWKKWKSDHSKMLWSNTVYARKVMGRRMQTGPEKKFEIICQDRNLPFRFVGNAQIRIGRWNPDFIITNGQNIVVEIFGRYYHSPENEFTRIAQFAQHNYNCLVIWEEELKDEDKIVERVLSFIGRN